MTPVPMDAAVAAWKRQLDVGIEFAEAIVEGAKKARDIQRAAAEDTYAWLEAARKSFAAAAPEELAALQTRLANENLGKIAQYCGRLAANARDTQVRIVEVMARGSAATPLLSERAPFSEAIDVGYKQWLDTLRKLYPTFAPAQSS